MALKQPPRAYRLVRRQVLQTLILAALSSQCMAMDPISLEELALLELLVEIDQASRAVHTKALKARLVDAGLIEADGAGELRLTDAGIERCKSLHHRVRADQEAADVLKEREQPSEAA